MTHLDPAQLDGPLDAAARSHLTSCAMCTKLVMALDIQPVTASLVDETVFDIPASPIQVGGMGKVYLARDKRLGRQVILKASIDGDGPAARLLLQERIKAEAAVLARLQHPSIVTLYEAGLDREGAPFCVLERVEGRSLREHLDELKEQEAKTGVFAQQERLQLLSTLLPIVDAVAYAHRAGIVHRDVTPRNIIIGPGGGAPTLIDWGIAKDITAADPYQEMRQDEIPCSSMGTEERFATLCAGTPPYVSVEQALGCRAVPSFDVYTLGATLYEVVSGRTPFPARLDAFWTAVRNSEPPTPLRNDPELSGIIQRAMARDPGQRFTAEQLLTALRQYLTGDLVFSHRYSRAGRLARWAKRRPWGVAAVLATVAILFGVLTVWAFRQRARAERHAVVAWTVADRKVDEADEAHRTAALARMAAEAAQRAGQTDAELRAIAAHAAQREASLRADAEVARASAVASSVDAVRRMHDALKERDEANRQRDEANRQRDEARAAAESATRERDQAIAAAAAAARERDQMAAAAREGDQAAARASDVAPAQPTPAPPSAGEP